MLQNLVIMTSKRQMLLFMEKSAVGLLIPVVQLKDSPGVPWRKKKILHLHGDGVFPNA